MYINCSDCRRLVHIQWDRLRDQQRVAPKKFICYSCWKGETDDVGRGDTEAKRQEVPQREETVARL